MKLVSKKDQDPRITGEKQWQVRLRDPRAGGGVE